MTETVVDIRRVAKTVAGGRRFTFDALVVVGDGQGRVGFGLGKAKEVPDAVQKGSAIARGSMSAVALLDSTVPQQVVSKFDGARVMLKPAAPGTGVRASAAVRAVVQAAGVRDILTKSLGSSNPVNVVRATIRGLHMMRDPQEVMALRRMVRGEPPLAPTEETAAPTAEAETPAEETAAPTAEAETPVEATAAEEPPTVAQEETPPVAEATEEEDQMEDSAPAEESPETAEAETPDEEPEAVDEAHADSDGDSEEKDS
jgi:small subunit ribosomal protein S5